MQEGRSFTIGKKNGFLNLYGLFYARLFTAIDGVIELSMKLILLFTGNNQAEAGPEGEVMPGQLEPTQDAAVNLPASLFQQIDNRTTIGIFFALYDTPTLFPINEERSVHSNETDVGSSVLSITVGPGLNFQELEHNITIILRLTPKNVRMHTIGYKGQPHNNFLYM